MKRYGLESRNWPTFLLKIPGALSPANGRQRTNIEVSEKYFPPPLPSHRHVGTGKSSSFLSHCTVGLKNMRGTPIYPPSGRTRVVRQFILPAEEHARCANLSSQRKNMRGTPIYPPSGRKRHWLFYSITV